MECFESQEYNWCIVELHLWQPPLGEMEEMMWLRDYGGMHAEVSPWYKRLHCYFAHEL